MDGLISIMKKPIIAPIRFGALRDDKMMKAEIAFTFDSDNDNGFHGDYIQIFSKKWESFS